MWRPGVGGVRGNAGAAPDRLPCRATARNERQSSHGIRSGIIHKLITDQQNRAISFIKRGSHSPRHQRRTTMAQQKTALVLGATGGVGGEMARALTARGWRIRALNRDPANISKPIEGIEWIRGDAMSRVDVVAPAEATALIVHGVN